MQGIVLKEATIEDLKDMFRSVLREEGWVPRDSLKPMTNREACDKLGISYKTLVAKMKLAGITELTHENVELLKHKYPKRMRIYPAY